MDNSLLVVGSSVVDLSFYSERLPQPGETLIGSFAQGLGGKGYNQAVSALKSGANTKFLSALGNDNFAHAFIEKTRELGIQARFETIAGSHTGAAAITIDRLGANQIIVAPGANAELSTDFLSENFNFFAGASILLLQFETNFSAIQTALAEFKRRTPNGIAILNPAPALSIPPKIMEQIDILTPNETELASLTGVKEINQENILDCCRRLSNEKTILVTLGERGVFCFDGKKNKGTLSPAFCVEAKDTSGAGDAFNGALAAALLENSSIADAIRFAQAAAALSIQKAGTSASMATKQEILALMKA